MSQVDRSPLSVKHFFSPLAFLGFAYLAGSQRLIQYFPETTRGGLLCIAAFSGGASYLYDAFYRQEEEGIIQQMIGKSIAIGLGVVVASLVAKSLQGRVSLSFSSALKFGVFEILAAACIDGVANREIPLQQKHRLYRENPFEWRILDRDERNQLIQAFYAGGYPGICMIGIEIEDLPIDFTAIDAMTPFQKSWAHEYEKAQFHIKDKYNPCSKENFLRFMDNVSKGVPFPHVELSYEVFQAMEQDQNLQDRFYQVLKTAPLYRYFLGESADSICENREVLPSLKDLIRDLDPQKVEKMSLGEAILWCHAFLNYPEEWKGVNATFRPLFVKQFILGLEFSWRKEELLMFRDSPGSIEALESILLTEAFQNRMTKDQRDYIQVLYHYHGCQIELPLCYHIIDTQVMPTCEAIEYYSRKDVAQWIIFLDRSEDSWKSLSPEVQSGLLKCFLSTTRYCFRGYLPENEHLYQAPQHFLQGKFLHEYFPYWMGTGTFYRLWGKAIIEKAIQRGDYVALSPEHKTWYFIELYQFGHFDEERVRSFFANASPCHDWLASLDYRVELAYRQRYQATYPGFFPPFQLKVYDEAFDRLDPFKDSSRLAEWVLKQWKETGTDCGFSQLDPKDQDKYKKAIIRFVESLHNPWYEGDESLEDEEVLELFKILPEGYHWLEGVSEEVATVYRKKYGKTHPQYFQF